MAVSNSPDLHVVAGVQIHCAASWPEVAQWHSMSGGFSDLKTLLEERVPPQAPVIWVIPKRFAARGRLPSAMVDGRPVGLMFADNSVELMSQWPSPGSAKTPLQRAILAQWDEVYLPTGRQWLKALGAMAGGGRKNWMADRIGGPKLCRRLARGARLCVYFGHGHHDGLAGYHGLYVEDFLAEPMAGQVESFLSFSCLNLAQPHGRPCLGRELVKSGRVRAFWGSVGHVTTDANRELARLGIDSLLLPHVRTIGDWIRDMNTKVLAAESRRLHSAWQLYRLVGHPGSLI